MKALIVIMIMMTMMTKVNWSGRCQCQASKVKGCLHDSEAATHMALILVVVIRMMMIISLGMLWSWLRVQP